VDDQQEMFDHVVNAWPKESLRTVLDLITDPPEDDPYQQLKDRLCQSHQLTKFQRVEKLHQLDSLGGRKPSEFLHEMAELCPTRHEDSPFFLFLFMQRLPKELRIVLGEVDDHEDIRAMAAKADKLWSLHNHQQHGVVASVDPGPSSSQPPATIAAVRTAGQGWTLRRPARQGPRPWQSPVCPQTDCRHHPFCSGNCGFHGEGLFWSLLLSLAVWRRRHPL
jgi:hypothetical protein